MCVCQSALDRLCVERYIHHFQLIYYMNYEKKYLQNDFHALTVFNFYVSIYLMLHMVQCHSV